MNRIVDSLCHALWDTNMVVTRLWLGVAEFFWFLLLAWPGDTFGRPSYYHMAHVTTEEAWAFIFLLSSVTQITIVLKRDFHGKMARYFAAWNAALWSFVVASIMCSVTPPPAAISGELTLAIAAVWIWIRPYLLAKGIERARTDSRF